jgi:hypothetical protein
VKRVRWKRQGWIPLVALLLMGAAAAQGNAVDQQADWRSANDAVGQFKRGHIDILKWEAENTADPVAAAKAQAGFALPTLEDAVRSAWKPHRELQSVMSRLGPQDTDRMATGKWLDVDTRHQRRIGDFDELLEIAVSARKAWLSAVAAKQALRLQQESLEAAEAATELGRRMVKVGNWSRYQQSRVELGLSAEKAAVQQARIAAAQSEQALLKLLRLNGVHSRLELPDSLPDLPKDVVGRERLDAELREIVAQLPLVNQTRTRTNFELALDARDAALAVAAGYRNEVMPQRNLIVDESVLQYNGMLKSVWDLLSEVQARTQSQRDTVNAVRDFWFAETDLLWVLQGGEPNSFVTPGAPAGDGAAAAAH